jgi:hypothetical protein
MDIYYGYHHSSREAQIKTEVIKAIDGMYVSSYATRVD